MKFPKQTLRLVSVRSLTSKNGKEMTFVKLANESTYENNDFMLGRETDVKSLLVQTCYDAELDIDGKYTSVNLYPVTEKIVQSSANQPEKKAS